MVPPALDPFCPAYKLLAIWHCARATAEATSSSTNNRDNSSGTQIKKKKTLHQLSYSMLVHVLQFCAGEIRFKCANTWGSGGSGWGSAPDLVIQETARLDMQKGIAISLIVRVGTVVVNSAALSPVGGGQQCRLFWKNEAGSDRAHKPINADVVFDAPSQTFRGACQYEREGPIGWLGRIRAYDPKTGQEITGPQPK